jgi:hypothetical protein
MNAEHIERGLRGMSEWAGEAPGLWERAVESLAAEPVLKTGRWWTHRWVHAAAAAAAVVLIAVGAIVPGLGGARSSHGVRLGKDFRGGATDTAPEIDLQGVLQSSQGGGGGESPFRYEPWAEAVMRSLLGGVAHDERASRASASRATIGLQSAEPEAQRLVVRKATMEIKTDDVRAAALQAQQLLSEPKGEYVESADIDDSDKDRPRADLVLRVEATRLEEVLTQLRELGEVSTERVDGEDVTDQMVDLGARLENERRVEAELLQLLEARQNDKLEEILAVRRELNGVREQIERLAAQQDNLSRMVRLSRVAVMLRAKATEPETKPDESVWGRFVDRLGEAWTDGLDALLGTIAGLVRVLVGGAIWFGAAAVLGLAAWRGWRRRHPRPLPE